MTRVVRRRGATWSRTARTGAVALAIAWLPACALEARRSAAPDGGLETIYVLRSIRERQAPPAAGCDAATTGFAPFATDAERFFSFWSVRSQAADGRVVDAKQARVAELRGCFGPTDNPARQHFFAEITLGSMAFRGSGECLALAIDVPEPGLFPVRCQLLLRDLPAPYVGGLLTTNTITSRTPFGGDSEPPGYTQASMATIRLWKGR